MTARALTHRERVGERLRHFTPPAPPSQGQCGRRRLPRIGVAVGQGHSREAVDQDVIRFEIIRPDAQGRKDKCPVDCAEPAVVVGLPTQILADRGVLPVENAHAAIGLASTPSRRRRRDRRADPLPSGIPAFQGNRPIWPDPCRIRPPGGPEGRRGARYGSASRGRQDRSHTDSKIFHAASSRPLSSNPPTVWDWTSSCRGTCPWLQG